MDYYEQKFPIGMKLIKDMESSVASGELNEVDNKRISRILHAFHMAGMSCNLSREEILSALEDSHSKSKTLSIDVEINKSAYDDIKYKIVISD